MISEPHMENDNDFIQQLYPISYNSNVLKMKTGWYSCRKINFKLLINNQLHPAWRVNTSKMFGYFFFSALGSQPNISTLSTLVFLLLQKFKLALHVRYCCIIIIFLSLVLNRQHSSKSYSRLHLLERS